MTLTAPRRPVRTYELHGREHYADTGRPVGEHLGSHIVLRVVDDAEARATAIEAEGDAELNKWPQKDRALAKARRNQRYESAAHIRADGNHRNWYGHYHDGDSAQDAAADLRRSQSTPGVHYEAVQVDGVGACPDCHQPLLRADGQWRHHALRYPLDCDHRPEPNQDEEPERIAPGDWVIDTGRGTLTCGYCNEHLSWGPAVLGYVRPTGDLVVLAEAVTLTGQTIALPHHCDQIPDDVLQQRAWQRA